MRVINTYNLTHLNLSQACSSDNLRPVMTGVFFDLKKNVMVATNSHLLMIVPIKIEWDKGEEGASEEYFNKTLEEQSKIVPVEFFNKNKYIGDWKKYDDEIKYDFSDPEYAFVRNMREIVFRCRYIEGKFPNYEAVYPTGEENFTKIGMDWSMVQRIYKAIPFRDKTLSFTFYGAGKPIAYKSFQNNDFRGLIMPTRL